MEPLEKTPRSGIGGVVDTLTGTTRLARKSTPVQPKAKRAPRLPRSMSKTYKSPPAKKNPAFPNDPNPAIANKLNVEYSP